MALIAKPDMEFIWASGGAIVKPSDTKIQTGWTPEVPPHQWENWIQKRQDEYLAHINQRGIPAWDGNTEYEAGGLSYVQGSDGKIYKSVAASGPSSVAQNPTTDATDTYWTVAFADVGAFLTQAAGDARYTQRANNLSDLTNTATARTNLGAAPVASPSFTGTPTAPTATVGTNTTQLATTAFVLSQISTSVPSASETVAGRVELATAAETTTGTDNTRAVHPAGLKVELDKKVPTSSPQICTAWVNFNGTDTVTIRNSYNVSSITDNGVGLYTINFATSMANANYSFALCSDNSGDNLPNLRAISTNPPTALALPIRTTDNGNAARDFGVLNVIVFGGK